MDLDIKKLAGDDPYALLDLAGTQLIARNEMFQRFKDSPGTIGLRVTENLIEAASAYVDACRGCSHLRPKEKVMLKFSAELLNL